MKRKINDIEYISIVNDILENDKFQETKLIDHHGISRFEHLSKISYRSYKIARMLNLDYVSVARAGLLHDFFPTNINRERKEWFFSTFNHAKKAEEHSSIVFELNEKEKDIIKTHMFPYSINLSVPKYAESWLVNIVDKIIGATEIIVKCRVKLVYAANLCILLLINSGK